jgi:peroxiredoxin (alkyl hydroperoxide reductase subunit C)
MEKNFSKFDELDTQVVGISTDSVYAQQAFAMEIKVNSFPLASDFKHQVGEAYGVMHPNGHTQRATVLIDKQGVVRWTQQVPLSQQRDINEFLSEIRKIEGKSAGQGGTTLRQ